MSVLLVKMVEWYFHVGLKLAMDMLALEPAGIYRPRSVTTQCELQSNVQVAATCAGLVGA